MRPAGLVRVVALAGVVLVGAASCGVAAASPTRTASAATVVPEPTASGAAGVSVPVAGTTSATVTGTTSATVTATATAAAPALSSTVGTSSAAVRATAPTSAATASAPGASTDATDSAAASAGATGGVTASASPTAGAEPTAAVFAGVPAVGALFSGSVSAGHGCSASVVDSAARDLVVTAAHCVSGTGAGLLFVPGYVDGSTPHGAWSVRAAYADPSWLSSQDPRHDYVFLRVAARVVDGRSQELQDVVGADTLGLVPAEGDTVTVDGYGAGRGDRPIGCTAAVTLTGDYPTFVCAGFVDGTSGGPWLADGAGSTPSLLVGVVGGLHQGGCEDDTSYSAPFDGDTVAAWERAAAGGVSDSLPTAGPSGC